MIGRVKHKTAQYREEQIKKNGERHDKKEKKQKRNGQLRKIQSRPRHYKARQGKKA